jgi:cell division protein FtsB
MDELMKEVQSQIQKNTDLAVADHNSMGHYYAGKVIALTDVYALLQTTKAALDQERQRLEDEIDDLRAELWSADRRAESAEDRLSSLDTWV